MKRILLIANIVLAVAVAALYVLFFTGHCQKKSAELSIAEGAADIAAGAIVYIQIDSLINSLDLFHDLRSDWEAKAKEADDLLTKRGRALERDYNDWLEKAQKGLITTSQRETQATQLESRQRELNQLTQQKQMELAEEEQVVLNNVLNEINIYLTTYNQEHNFTLILTTSGNPGTIIVGNPSLDITKDIITGLNARYAVQRNRKK